MQQHEQRDLTLIKTGIWFIKRIFTADSCFQRHSSTVFALLCFIMPIGCPGPWLQVIFWSCVRLILVSKLMLTKWHSSFRSAEFKSPTEPAVHIMFEIFPYSNSKKSYLIVRRFVSKILRSNIISRLEVQSYSSLLVSLLFELFSYSLKHLQTLSILGLYW